MKRFRVATGWLAAFLCSAGLASSETITIDFEINPTDTLLFDHGEIIDTQYFASLGVTISTINIGGGPDLGIIFDSNETSTLDPDLEFMNFDPTGWSGGNIQTVDLGNMLIIEQDGTGFEDGIVDDPNDEGSRPAGSFTFDFSEDIFAFDIVDVESLFLEDGTVDFFSGGGLVTPSAIVPFSAFGVTFGDNVANRVPWMTTSTLTIDPFRRVVINMGGSGAVDNIRYTRAAEPGSLLLMGLGLVGLAAWRRRHHTSTGRPDGR